MKLRRALLLFVVVLGMAALVAALADRPRDAATSRPDASTSHVGSAPKPSRVLRFTAGSGRTRTRKLPQGDAATITVSARAPGQIEIPSLGVSSPVDPMTPTSIPIFENRPGSHAIRFEAADSQHSTAVGKLVVLAETGR